MNRRAANRVQWDIWCNAASFPIAALGIDEPKRQECLLLRTLGKVTEQKPKKKARVVPKSAYEEFVANANELIEQWSNGTIGWHELRSAYISCVESVDKSTLAEYRSNDQSVVQEAFLLRERFEQASERLAWYLSVARRLSRTRIGGDDERLVREAAIVAMKQAPEKPFINAMLM